METETKGDVQRIREAFDRLAEAFSSEQDGIPDLLPVRVAGEWDELLEAIEQAEEQR